MVKACDKSGVRLFVVKQNRRNSTLQLLKRAVQQKLKDASIPTAVHYPIPLNKQPAVADLQQQLPVGDKVAEEVISLPMHPYIPELRQDLIVEVIKSCIK